MSKLDNREMNIQLSPRVNELREVNVSNTSEINAVSLGIIPEEIEILSTNERRLRTAGDFKWIHLLGLLAGSLEIDPSYKWQNEKAEAKYFKRKEAAEYLVPGKLH